MLFYLFLVMAAIAFIGFFMHSQRRNGHGMAYTAVLLVVWLAAAGWAGGYFGT